MVREKVSSSSIVIVQISSNLWLCHGLQCQVHTAAGTVKAVQIRDCLGAVRAFCPSCPRRVPFCLSTNTYLRIRFTNRYTYTMIAFYSEARSAGQNSKSFQSPFLGYHESIQWSSHIATVRLSCESTTTVVMSGCRTGLSQATKGT